MGSPQRRSIGPVCQGELEIPFVCLVFVLLLTDVLLHGFDFKSDGGDGIASRPEVFSREVLLFSGELSGNGDCTLAFQESNHRRNGEFGGNLDHHVDMIRHHMTFDDGGLFLSCEGVEDGTKGGTDSSIQALSPTFWNEDEMVFAVPLTVG